jgi:hypothetical protein
MNKDDFALLPCINMTDRCPVYKRLVAISQIIDGELPSASNNNHSNEIALLEATYKHLDYPFSEGMRSLTLARANINKLLAQLRAIRCKMPL